MRRAMRRVRRYVVFYYNVVGERIFVPNDKEDSCFLTKGEAQRKVQNILSAAPMASIVILREIKNIREKRRYWVLVETEERFFYGYKLAVVDSNTFHHQHEGGDLLRNKKFRKGKFVLEQVYATQIKVTIKER
jgi:hypothetical protein